MKKIIPIIKVICFTLVFCIIFSYFTVLSKVKTAEDFISAPIAEGFYAEEKNTLDAVFVGSCHIHYNVNPLIIWENYGIPCYDFSSGDQQLEISKLSVKEIFKTQSPKVVLLDVLAVASENSYTTGGISKYYLPTFASFPLSVNKIEAAYELRDKVNFFEAAFSLFFTKGALLETTSEDFSYFKDDKTSDTKGYIALPVSREAAIDNESVLKTDEAISISKEKYLREIVEIVRDNGAEIVFIKSPYQYVDYENGFYNRLEEIAQELDVDYLDLNRNPELINIEPGDLWDAYHFSFIGSEKYSDLLGGYLAENFSLESHKGEEAYRSWDNLYEKYYEESRAMPEAVS